MMYYYLSSLIFFFLSILMFFFSLVMLIFKISYFFEWNILMINSFNLNMFIYLDWMSLMFIFTVMFISSMILIYSSEYMGHDFNKIRFFMLLLLFIISMFLLILSPSLISILIGWDGLGLISYCLVIYYQSFYSYNSGMLTVLMNRIGDVFILLSLGLLINFGSWNFLNLNFLNLIILIMIVLAAFTKSAQFPFSSWLPVAMAAPTPVSSLVHSSTLVTAGVYLLIRFHYLIYKFMDLIFFLMIIGLITMVFAGLSANFEFDFKKIIAYSTLSQLGLMMMIIGIGNFELAFFHLVVHAMFKSMMFMCSGIVIHSSLNYQDIRYMGFLFNFMPLTFMIFSVSNFSLCGMPFFSGFYSKDFILEYSLMSKMNLFSYFFMILGTGLTVSYSIRLMMYLMNNSLNFFPLMNIYDCKKMNFSMILLLIMTIFLGMILNWIQFMMIEEIFLLWLEKLLILIVCIIFVFLGMMIYFLKKMFLKFYFFKYFFGKMWFLYLLNFILNLLFLKVGLKFFLLLDKGFSEWIFKNLIIKNLKFTNLMSLNLNFLINFLLMICFYMLILLLFY
uniref:NADH-ubiquinone oxidoreductase chain 5 n=1 Tax=Sycophila sp. 2 JXW-2020 TaxID=2781670 RepID=A0A8A3USJ8_9HYME|nr:NADH dehydrogenase subunit 5 [Sycophila sp. 2 JXW-2020]